MKKAGLILIYLLLLSSLVPAQITKNTSAENASSLTINEKIDKTISQQINLPEPWNKIVSIAFNLKSEDLNLQQAMVLTALFIFFVLLIKEILDVTPFFNKKIDLGLIELPTSLIGSIIVTLLVSITGGLLLAYSIIMDFATLFGLLSKWPAGALVFTIIVLIVISIIASKLLNILQDTMELQKAHEKGIKAATGIKVAEVMGKSIIEGEN